MSKNLSFKDDSRVFFTACEPFLFLKAKKPPRDSARRDQLEADNPQRSSMIPKNETPATAHPRSRASGNKTEEHDFSFSFRCRLSSIAGYLGCSSRLEQSPCSPVECWGCSSGLEQTFCPFLDPPILKNKGKRERAASLCLKSVKPGIDSTLSLRKCFPSRTPRKARKEKHTFAKTLPAFLLPSGQRKPDGFHLDVDGQTQSRF